MTPPVIAIHGRMEDSANANLHDRMYARTKPVRNAAKKLVTRATFSSIHGGHEVRCLERWFISGLLLYHLCCIRSGYGIFLLSCSVFLYLCFVHSFQLWYHTHQPGSRYVLPHFYKRKQLYLLYCAADAGMVINVFLAILIGSFSLALLAPEMQGRL